MSQCVAGAAIEHPLEGVAEDTANAIGDCRGPLQGPRNDTFGAFSACIFLPTSYFLLPTFLSLRAPPDVVFLGNRARTAHKKD